MTTYIALPVYYCRRCNQHAPHSILTELISGKRGIAQCQACGRTHVYRQGDEVVEP